MFYGIGPDNRITTHGHLNELACIRHVLHSVGHLKFSTASDLPDEQVRLVFRSLQAKGHGTIWSGHTQTKGKVYAPATWPSAPNAYR